ncbi:MAG TPA: hypothetical protein VIL78_18725 [Hanamia sp.]
MAISPSIDVLQSAITPSSFTVVDTSPGTLGTISKRRIYVSDAFGNYITGNGTVNYTDWSIADSSIILNILTEDIGANIQVDWLDSSNVVIDTFNDTYPLAEFNKQFLYYLVQLIGLSPATYQDTNYSGNIGLFWTNIIAGINAVEYGNDIAAGQNCFSRATFMRLHQSLYF